MSRVNPPMSRFIDHPYGVIAAGSAIVSAGGATRAAVLGVIDQDTIVSITAASVAAGAVALKWFSELREKQRAADVADAEAKTKTDQDAARSWKEMVEDAAKDSNEAKRQAAESEAKLITAKALADAEIAALKAQLVSVKNQNAAQADQLSAIQERLARLGVSQNEVVQAVNSQTKRVRQTEKRVDAVEKATGSISGSDIPTSPDPSTSPDLPTLDGK